MQNNTDGYKTIRIGDEWTVPAEDGIGRRTIVQATAWTVPVVAMAVGAPLATASTNPTDNVLVFDENLYTPDADCLITGVTTTLTDADGAPVAGELVTLTLPSGYTFADGSTVTTLPSDASGTVAWPDITAQPGAGTFTLNATTPTAPAASADVVIVDETTVFEYNATTNTTIVLGAIPAGATPLGAGFFQTSNGDIYKWNVATPVITGAGPAKGYSGNGVYFLEYTKDGVAHTYRSSNGNIANYAHIPGDAVPVGGGYFLSPDGRLWAWNRTGGPIATGVTSASGYLGTGNGSYFVDFVNATGGHDYSSASQATRNYTSISSNATAVGGGFFLDGTTLRYGNTLISNNVASASGYPASRTDGTYWVDYVLTNGNAWESNAGGTDSRKSNIPANSTPVGGGYFLAPDGTLYSWKGSGTRVPGGSGVAAAVGYESAGNAGGYWTDFVLNPSGCLV